MYVVYLFFTIISLYVDLLFSLVNTEYEKDTLIDHYPESVRFVHAAIRYTLQTFNEVAQQGNSKIKLFNMQGVTII